MSAAIGCSLESKTHPPSVAPMPFEYAWIEGPAAVRLGTLEESADWNDLSKWPCGRLFGSIGEYRWRQRGELLHAVLLMEDGDLGADFGYRVALELVREEELVLWGEWI